jgi:hypothetical protein
MERKIAQLESNYRPYLIRTGSAAAQGRGGSSEPSHLFPAGGPCAQRSPDILGRLGEPPLP